MSFNVRFNLFVCPVLCNDPAAGSRPTSVGRVAVDAHAQANTMENCTVCVCDSSVCCKTCKHTHPDVALCRVKGML